MRRGDHGNREDGDNATEDRYRGRRRFRAGRRMGSAPSPRPFRLPAVRGAGADRRQCGHSRHAAGRRQLDPLRYLRHRLHPVRVSPHPVADEAVRHRTGRYEVQLQREVRRPGLRPRFRIRRQRAAAARDREVPAAPEASATVRLAHSFPVEVPERAQPVQLRQHGDGPEPGRFLRRLPVQGTEAHVRQLPDGDERVRHACGALLKVPRVLRYRDRYAHADVGPRDTAHLREPVGQLP